MRASLWLITSPFTARYGTLCIRENPGCLFIATNRDAVTHLTDAQEWAGLLLNFLFLYLYKMIHQKKGSPPSTSSIAFHILLSKGYAHHLYLLFFPIKRGRFHGWRALRLDSERAPCGGKALHLHDGLPSERVRIQPINT